MDNADDRDVRRAALNLKYSREVEGKVLPGRCASGRKNVRLRRVQHAEEQRDILYEHTSLRNSASTEDRGSRIRTNERVRDPVEVPALAVDLHRVESVVEERVADKPHRASCSVRQH